MKLVKRLYDWLGGPRGRVGGDKVAEAASMEGVPVVFQCSVQGRVSGVCNNPGGCRGQTAGSQVTAHKDARRFILRRGVI